MGREKLNDPENLHIKWKDIQLSAERHNRHSLKSNNLKMIPFSSSCSACFRLGYIKEIPTHFFNIPELKIHSRFNQKSIYQQKFAEILLGIGKFSEISFGLGFVFENLIFLFFRIQFLNLVYFSGNGVHRHGKFLIYIAVGRGEFEYWIFQDLRQRCRLCSRGKNKKHLKRMPLNWDVCP